MAISSTLLAASPTACLAPPPGLRYGSTSMWICNNDPLNQLSCAIYVGNGTNLANTIINILLNPNETREFPLERIALEGGIDSITGVASVGGQISVNVSYIILT